jgi:hypothetical protein
MLAMVRKNWTNLSFAVLVMATTTFVGAGGFMDMPPPEQPEVRKTARTKAKSAGT